MTLHQLEVFVEVAQMLNVSRASSALRISQPAVTHQIKALQEEFGLTLYRTSGHGIELTDEGQRFLEHTRTILERVKKMEESFKQKPICASRPLRVGACYPATASVLPTILRDFTDAHPSTRFSLHTDNSATLQRLVCNSELDVALILDSDTNDRSLIYEPLWRDTPLVAASGDFVLGNRRLADGDDAVEPAPIIAYKDRNHGGLTGQIIKFLEQGGIRTEIVMDCSSCEAVRAAVRSGLGMGIFFYDFIAPDLASGNLRLVDVPGLEKLAVTFFAVHLKEKPLAPELNEFLAPLRNRRTEKENGEGKWRREKGKATEGGV